MNHYKVTIKYKKGISSDLVITLDQETDLREELAKDWKNILRDRAIQLGKEIIFIDDVLRIKIEGDTIDAKLSGEEL